MHQRVVVSRMDLSQQELPLTSYFTRGNKDSKPRKKNKPEQVLQSVARPSKRKKDDAGLPLAPLQLPTPATATRKRIRGGHAEKLSGNTQLHLADVFSTVEHDAVLSSEKRPAQPESGPTPGSSCQGAKDTIVGLPSTSLATPMTGRRKTANPIVRGSSPSPQLPIHTEAGIATPRTLSRQVPVPTHRIDCTPLTHPNRSLQNTDSLPSRRMDGQSSDHVPMFPIPSSQSQYLLHIDATPRKQRLQRVEDVISSQTQEERELTLSSRKPVTMFGISIDCPSRKSVPLGNTQTPCLSPGRRKSRCAQVLDHSPVGSPSGPSRFFAKKKADELSSGSPSSLQRVTCHSPTRKTRAPRGLAPQDSIENIPPACIDGSATEPESDPDIAPVKVPRYSPSRDGCLPVRQELAHNNLPAAEDDSATEAESDTEILRCVAEIGKKRLRDGRPEIPREESPPAPLVSPLVSPARSRIAPMPSIIGSTRLSVREGAESVVIGSSTSYQSTAERPSTCSDSLPSVVRDFIRMFPGDESYPADFPESLRV